MAKNYKKLYSTLKRNLRSELQVISKGIGDMDGRCELMDKLEAQGMILLLEHLFSEYIPELEGKKWGNVFLNKEEFKKWKKEINAK